MKDIDVARLSRVDAFGLMLKSRRLDLIFKYLYVVHGGEGYFKRAYLENIQCFNGFHEGNPSDGRPKVGRDAFVASFDGLIASIKDRGFDDSCAVPVGGNGEINDGAHRLAIAAALGMEIPIRGDSASSCYDWRFFRRQHMDEAVMDFGALEFVKLNCNAYVVNLHAAIDAGEDPKVEAILEKYGFIYYKKNVQLTFNGYVNLKKISYGSFWNREKWIGTPENRFAGARDHAKRSMGGKRVLRAYVFVCDSADKAVAAKKEIRALFGIGNYSVHINDTHDEAVWLASTYFNANSLFALNSRPFCFEDERFERMVMALQNHAREQRVDPFDICGVDGAALNALGVGKTATLDFIHSGRMPFFVHDAAFADNESQLSRYPCGKAESLYDPSRHFYFQGMKFVSPGTLFRMKLRRHRWPGDFLDCMLAAYAVVRGVVRCGPLRSIAGFFVSKTRNGDERHVTICRFIHFSYSRKRNKKLGGGEQS